MIKDDLDKLIADRTKTNPQFPAMVKAAHRTWWPGKKTLTRREIETWASKYDAKLRADDPRLRGAVHIVHDEGTTFFLMYAFIVQVGDWLVVFSEHHGYMVYGVDEISYTILKPTFRKARRMKS
jgi:hypothetical protein